VIQVLITTLCLRRHRKSIKEVKLNKAITVFLKTAVFKFKEKITVRNWRVFQIKVKDGDNRGQNKN